MTSPRPGLLVLAMLFGACPGPSEVACPPGMARDSRRGDLCVCVEDGQQLSSALNMQSYPACDPVDTRDFQGAWLFIETFLDLGGTGLTPAGQITSEVFCVADGFPRNFLERDAAECKDCNCNEYTECTPAGCLGFCGPGVSCGIGQTCSSEGLCRTCGFQQDQVQCGGGPDGCGVCPGGTMCVEGHCTALLRCAVSPSALCDVPDWCPLDVRMAAGPIDFGSPCTCFYENNGSVCQQFNGFVEFF